MIAGPGSPSCIAAILLLLAHTVLSISSDGDFSDGFPCSNSGIQLNGNRPFPRFVSNGINDMCTLQLTSDKAEARAVSAFTNVASEDGYFWFESRFRYKIAGSAAGSADGIAAVFHQDPRAQTALGGIGGNLGVYGSSSRIIKNALVVEFDTRK
jgi:Bacterial lectin